MERRPRLTSRDCRLSIELAATFSNGLYVIDAPGCRFPSRLHEGRI